MSEKTPKILFMDDEPTSDIVVHAVERLCNAGFAVDFVETMSEAIEAYYQKYYDVFILDIDMSHQAADQEGDGVKVLKRFISLHNQTRVILFSGAGTVQHWFQAANAHCYAYVHKLDNDQTSDEDSIEILIRQVRAATAETTAPMVLFGATPPPKVLLIGGDPEFDAPARTAIHEALGADWAIDAIALDAVDTAELTAYGVLVLLQRTFSTRAKVREALAKVLATAPQPHTIIGCEGRDESRPSILYIANRHPFRLLDLSDPQWPTLLQQALTDARIWYGKPEIFQADMDALRRIHITLPEDLAAQWEDFDEDDLITPDNDDDPEAIRP